MNLAPAVTAPPFCPNPECRFHRSDRHLWRFVRIGFYVRQSAPFRVQRYRCDTCRRKFADQTFSTTYWMKRPDLLVPVFHRLVGCSGFRQIASEFGVSPQTIGRVSDRPTSYHVAAGQRTHFFYGFTDSECRRRGTMTRAQKRRRAHLEARTIRFPRGPLGRRRIRCSRSIWSI